VPREKHVGMWESSARTMERKATCTELLHTHTHTHTHTCTHTHTHTHTHIHAHTHTYSHTHTHTHTLTHILIHTHILTHKHTGISFCCVDTLVDNGVPSVSLLAHRRALGKV
jgi:hypothetical protein